MPKNVLTDCLKRNRKMIKINEEKQRKLAHGVRFCIGVGVGVGVGVSFCIGVGVGLRYTIIFPS